MLLPAAKNAVSISSTGCGAPDPVWYAAITVRVQLFLFIRLSSSCVLLLRSRHVPNTTQTSAESRIPTTGRKAPFPERGLGFPRRSPSLQRTARAAVPAGILSVPRPRSFFLSEPRSRIQKRLSGRVRQWVTGLQGVAPRVPRSSPKLRRIAGRVQRRTPEFRGLPGGLAGIRRSEARQGGRILAATLFQPLNSQLQGWKFRCVSGEVLQPVHAAGSLEKPAACHTCRGHHQESQVTKWT